MNQRQAAEINFFNPQPQVRKIALTRDQSCWVVDDVLADPAAWVDWAGNQVFKPPGGFPYPGLVADVPAAFNLRMADYFGCHLRRLMGARRVLDSSCRLSLITVQPERLDPRQWQCHRDLIAADPRQTLFAASVLYLFHETGFGGTSFYIPRQSDALTDEMVLASQTLAAGEFSQRYGLQAGYMLGSNAYFECIANVPAAWNRLIFYNGSLFHSADIGQPALLSANPTLGRLTLNGFLTCRRNAS